MVDCQRVKEKLGYLRTEGPEAAVGKNKRKDVPYRRELIVIEGFRRICGRISRVQAGINFPSVT